jgi:general L-amino acid transport system substrate-binding protein
LYLVANKKLSSNLISSPTQTIMSVRRDLLREEPLFAQITAPSTDADAFLPLHPGAAAFYNGTQQSFMDEYGSAIYLTPMVMGGIASVLAAAWKFLGIGNPEIKEGPLDSLYSLARRIRKVDTERELADIEDEIDNILKAQRVMAASGDENAVDASTLNVAAHRLETHDRRAILAKKPAVVPATTNRETQMLYFEKRHAILTAVILLVVSLVPADRSNAQTLKGVQERGTLNCGVSQGLLGFSSADDKGTWTGFDVDICRAVAAAIFDDPAKVTFVPLDTASRFTALQSNRIDVLSRNSTWTMSRENSLGLMFAGVAYYDGQGFLLRRDAGIDTALQLGGKTICTQTGTTTELNLSDYFRANDMDLKVLALGTAEETLNAYDDGKCDVLTSDVSQLYAERLKLAAPDRHIILPEVISKEPLGPVVRQGDDQWFNLVKWTLYSLINSEELGIKSKSIDDAVKSTNPNVRRLLGTEGEFGVQLGLTKDWAARAVRAVGNYGEIYERNVGTQSRLSIPRGLNALWTQGGIQYAPPIR